MVRLFRCASWALLDESDQNLSSFRAQLGGINALNVNRFTPFDFEFSTPVDLESTNKHHFSTKSGSGRRFLAFAGLAILSVVRQGCYPLLRRATTPRRSRCGRATHKPQRAYQSIPSCTALICGSYEMLITVVWALITCVLIFLG